MTPRNMKRFAAYLGKETDRRRTFLSHSASFGQDLQDRSRRDSVEILPHQIGAAPAEPGDYSREVGQHPATALAPPFGRKTPKPTTGFLAAIFAD
jgi:hypothetical protein